MMGLNNLINVSVVVASYNPNLDKLLKTINSIIIQQNITFQIIITDDGSKNDYFFELEQFFNNIKFKNFILIKNKINMGTVKNIKKALDICDGTYTKLISPGDCLYDKYTLYRWVTYYMSENEVKFVRHKAWPQNTFVYKDTFIDNSKIINNYLLFNDTIHGATLIGKTLIYKKYFEMGIDIIKYAEDCLYRLMVFDGVSIKFFPYNVIFYEYGSGISTRPDKKWQSILKKDIQATDKIILELSKNNSFIRNFNLVITSRDNPLFLNKIKSYIFVHGLFIEKCKNKFFKRYTKVNIPDNLVSILK